MWVKTTPTCYFTKWAPIKSHLLLGPLGMNNNCNNNFILSYGEQAACLSPLPQTKAQLYIRNGRSGDKMVWGEQLQLIDSSCVQEGAGLGAPKQTEGLCIVLSVSTASTEGRRETRTRRSPGGQNKPRASIEKASRSDLCSFLQPFVDRRSLALLSLLAAGLQEKGAGEDSPPERPIGRWRKERDMNPSSA